MKKLSFIFAFLALLVLESRAQGSEDFNNVSGTAAGTYGNKTVTGGTVKWTCTEARSDQSIYGKAVAFRKSGKVTSDPISGGVGTLTFSCKGVYSGGNGTLTIKVGSQSFTKPYAKDVINDYSITVNEPGPCTIQFGKQSTSKTNRVAVDKISWTSAGPVITTPSLSATPTSLTGIDYASGSASPSASKSFALTGSALTGDVTVSSASSNFEISKSAGSGYSNSLTFTPSSGSISSTVYVRLKGGLADNTYSGTINISGGGATATSVTVTGEVTAVVSPPAGGGCMSDLIISEYVEGSGSNKYLEIYNGTGADVDLSKYSLKLYNNGSTSPDATNNLSGILADGATKVYKQSGASIYSGAVTSAACAFNGDDVIALAKNGTNIDVFGVIGNAHKDYFAQDATFIRKPHIKAAYASFDRSQWIEHPKDYKDDLGKHDAQCGPEVEVFPNQLFGFSYVQGGSNTIVKDFELKGRSLTGDVTVTAPANFLVSTSPSGGFAASITTSAMPSTKIHVKLKNALLPNSYTGDITFSGGGLTTAPKVRVQGNVYPPCTASTVPQKVTLLEATTTLSNDAQITWTLPYCYDQILVVAGEQINFPYPSPSGTTYTANSNYAGPGQVVYYGSGNTVTVTGLTSGKEYFFKVFVRKGNNWSTDTQTSLLINSGPTILNPGDLAIVAYDSFLGNKGIKYVTKKGNTVVDKGTDQWTLVNLVDLNPGTKFWIANATFELKAGPNQRTNRWYTSSESRIAADLAAQELEYKGTVPLPKGSLICIKVRSSDYIKSEHITVTPKVPIAGTPTFVRSRVLSPGNLGVNISTTRPDAIFFMQGEWSKGLKADGTEGGTDHRMFDGVILGGLIESGKWFRFDERTPSTASDESRRSRVPPTIECYSIQSIDNSGKAYAYYTGSRSGTQTEILRRLTDISNWNVSGTTSGNDIENITCVSSYTFDITGTLKPGLWVSKTTFPLSDNDWFNCHNWNNLAAPNKNIDVTIDPVSDRDIHVDIKSPLFDGAPSCRNIDISKNKLIVANATGDTYLNVHGTLHTSGTGEVHLQNSTSTEYGIINILGDWSQENFSPGHATSDGKVVFGKITDDKGNVYIASKAQRILAQTDGETVSFPNVVINNSSGIDLQDAGGNRKSALALTGTLTFENGSIRAGTDYKSTTQDARVEFLTDANYTGADANKHVVGWVRKHGNKAFAFPIGDGSFYPPLKIGAGTDAFGHFTAMYVHQDANTDYDRTSKASTLDHISACEFWVLNRTAGTSNVDVTLPYTIAANERSCGVDVGHESELRIAHWDGTEWKDEGGTANTSVKEVTSNTMTSFSPITLSSTTNFNPLPLTLIDFRGHVNRDEDAILEWETSNEINVKGFEVEFSKDGKTFTKIGFVKAKDVQSTINTYNLIDINFAGLTYYRLKIIDNDGSFEYSRVITLHRSSQEEGRIVIYPNPTNNQQVSIQLGNIDKDTKLMMSCYSAYGQELIKMEGTVEELTASLNATISNAKGVYLVNIYHNGKQYATKLINN